MLNGARRGAGDVSALRYSWFSLCNLYQSTPRDKINAWHLVQLPQLDYAAVIAPLKPGPFVMACGASAVGQWGMIPASSTTRRPMTTAGKPMSTNNARRETLASAWTYRFAWARGQRCLIPCDSFDEPYWGTGKNIWWRFHRAGGQPWALAGIWNERVDPATGESVPNFSMVTQNCDARPLLSQMHKPDPALAATGRTSAPWCRSKPGTGPVAAWQERAGRAADRTA